MGGGQKAFWSNFGHTTCDKLSREYEGVFIEVCRCSSDDFSLRSNAIKHFFARELNTKSGWVKIGIWERKYRIDIKKDCVAHVNYS